MLGGGVGVHTVTVEKAGYQSWTEQVQVAAQASGPCRGQPEPVTVQVRLVPMP